MEGKAQSPAAGAARMIGVEPGVFARHNGPLYRAPIELRQTPDAPAKFLVVGACLAQAFPEVAAMINPAFVGEFVLLNNFDAFPKLPSDKTYDFQIVHLPLRTILGNAYFSLPNDLSAHETFFEQTRDFLSRYLDNVLQLNTNKKLQTFLLGFLVPQQNPMGRFLPRYDLRNVMFFIEKLNMFLAERVAERQNVYFVDLDQISAGIGKRCCQDDMVWSFTHGTSLSAGDHDHDLTRIEPPMPMQNYYAVRWFEFFQATLYEIFSMRRTLLRQDTVKLVAVDLDDTLWRGIAAEGTLGVLEGWPMGFMEALLCLKQRGILLAIVSKNDEAFIRSRWDEIVGGQIALSDFAAVRINFRPKAENLAEILNELNLRPNSAVMVDDNPVERAAISAGLPGVRVVGAHLYYLKRILLWAPETQQEAITSESANKTEMAQAQLQRESVRKTLSHEDFLKTLQLKVRISTLHGIHDLQMVRALELLNKTNQFNTIGARYILEQCHQRFEAGMEMIVISAEDRFTKYGLVGVAWLEENVLEQLAMSCRALGMGIEEALLANLSARQGVVKKGTLLGKLIPTEINKACHDFFSRNGFTQVSGEVDRWERAIAVAGSIPVPGHVSLMAEEPVEKIETSISG